MLGEICYHLVWTILTMVRRMEKTTGAQAFWQQLFETKAFDRRLVANHIEQGLIFLLYILVAAPDA